jgi:hypothetical protein
VIRTALAAVGLAAGITLAASPALAATASHQPFSLSVSPGRLAAGTKGSVRKLIVANSGTKPVSIRAELSELSRNSAGRCAVGPLGTLPWAAVKPLSFTLPPGGHKTATLTIGRQVPGGAHDLVAAFVAAPGQGNGGVTVSGAVGAQMEVQGHGAVTAAAAHPCLAPAGVPPKPHIAAKPAAARSIPWALVTIGALLAAVIALLLVVNARQRRRIRAGTPTAAS